MSDDEVIRFEITDYDLDNEFNINRGGRKNKKEHQIYGMWAKDSDDDENEDNVRQRVRKPKDFSAPIGFVAGGVQQAGKKKSQTKKEIEPAEPTSSRVSFAPDSSDEDDKPEAPHESETAGIRRAGQGMRSVNLGTNMGNWERHTKGIGAKLLLQMGYEPGKGLGKDLQGISAPVEASVRKGRGAIGAYGPEKAAQKAKKEELKRLQEKEEAEKKPEKALHWKKSHKGRYFYRDAADVIQEGKPTNHTIASSSLARVPVIDLRGPAKRVLSGYHALRAAAEVAPRYEHTARPKTQNFAAPELMHNLELLLECCEQDIILNDKDLHKAEDDIVVLQRELEESEKKLEENDQVIDKMNDIISKVEELNRPDVSMEGAYEVLADLKTKHPLEYDMFAIGTVGGHVTSPLFSAMLATWDPLTSPEEPEEMLKKWRLVLSQEAYTDILWQHYVPPLERAVESWNPRSAESMQSAITVCSALSPGRVLRHVLRRVVGALLAAVERWDPTGDTQPIHSWLLPWHDVAGDLLSTSVYPLVRSRLAAALSNWHPSDRSARPLLAVWRNAWGPALAPLLVHHVLPKLQLALRHAPVHCAAAAAETWQWCEPWLELVEAPSLAAVLSSALLSRWLATWAAWLNTGPQHSAVLNEYTQFKKLFPEAILREPCVREMFRKALEMMNRSIDVDLESLPGPIQPPPPPRFTLTEDTTKIALPTQANTFSQLLEGKCAEKGITYVPMPGKFREGRPLFKIGASMQCYVIRNVIMYSNDSGSTFSPISLDRILSLAEE